MFSQKRSRFDNDDKYGKAERQSIQRAVGGFIAAMVILFMCYTIFGSSGSQTSRVAGNVPEVELVDFHPGTFKTLGNTKFEADMKKKLRNMIQVYKPKVHNSMETAYFHMLQIRVSQEWDFVMGSVTEFPQQWMTYYWETAQRYKMGKVKTVCEIGMGNGHSSALWLTATSSERSFKEGATFHLFDICRETPKKKQSYAKDYLKKVFGDRFVLHCGKSAETMTNMEDLKCDVLHIDGDHGYDGVVADIKMGHKRSSPGAVVFMDDLDYKEIDQAVKENKDILGVIANIQTTHTDFNLRSVRHRHPADGGNLKRFFFGAYKTDEDEEPLQTGLDSERKTKDKSSTSK